MTEGEGAATSDLFFGLAAILIVLLCLASRPVQQALAAAEPDYPAPPGQWLAVADAEGVVLTRPGASAARLGLDQIEAGRVARWAEGARAAPLVIVTAEAVDSAFLLDSALAQAGVGRVARVRLTGPCPRPRPAADGVRCDG